MRENVTTMNILWKQKKRICWVSNIIEIIDAKQHISVKNVTSRKYKIFQKNKNSLFSNLHINS